MQDQRKTFLDRCIRGKDGAIVLGQKPNVYQIIGLLALLLSWPLTGTAGHIAGLVSVAAWLVWALLEIFTGVNYFRQVLGLGVLILLIIFR